MFEAEHEIKIFFNYTGEPGVSFISLEVMHYFQLCSEWNNSHGLYIIRIPLLRLCSRFNFIFYTLVYLSITYLAGSVNKALIVYLEVILPFLHS